MYRTTWTRIHSSWSEKYGLRLSVFSDHRRVNLYLRVWVGWCVRRTQRFILVRTERPYVQFAAARVTGTWFAVWVTNRRERERILSLWWKEWTGAKSSIAAQPCVRVVLVFLSRGLASFHGAPCFLFYRRMESTGYSGERGGERDRERKASMVVGSFFSFMRVLLILHSLGTFWSQEKVSVRWWKLPEFFN